MVAIPFIDADVSLMLVIVLPLLAIPGLIFSRSSQSLQAIFQLFVCLVTLFGVSGLFLGGKEFESGIHNLLPGGVPLAFKVDQLGLGFAGLVAFLWVVTTVYSVGYLRESKVHKQTTFFCSFAVSIAATLGVAFSANLLTLYLFYELLTFATYPLVTHHRNYESMVAGRKYLGFMLGSATFLLLPTLVYLYSSGASFAFSSSRGANTAMEAALSSGFLSHSSAAWMLLLLTFGFAKVALMPLHAWLPAAMVAPTPVSALLHAVAVVKVGVFSLIRVWDFTYGQELISKLSIGSFSVNTLVAVIASITILFSSLIALAQDSLKRRLAYSTISQLAICTLGLTASSSLMPPGVAIHAAAHAFGKITLFLCAGAIYVTTGKKYVSELGGVGRRMPWTMGAFLIASLSLIGIPPFAGFWSKSTLVSAALSSNEPWTVIVYLTSSLLTASYLLPMCISAFWGGGVEGSESSLIEVAKEHSGEATICILAAISVAALATVVFGFGMPGRLFWQFLR
jgi:multicomponent Na+:H+ antiporter subunit D